MGSNKSNSSAVDQILEHYRKERRDRDRAAANNGGRATPSSSIGEPVQRHHRQLARRRQLRPISGDSV